MTTQENNVEKLRKPLSAASVSIKLEKVMTETAYEHYSDLARQKGFAGLKTYLLEQIDNAIAALHQDSEE